MMPPAPYPIRRLDAARRTSVTAICSVSIRFPLAGGHKHGQPTLFPATNRPGGVAVGQWYRLGAASAIQPGPEYARSESFVPSEPFCARQAFVADA